jgi:signal transduction histidine kinase
VPAGLRSSPVKTATAQHLFAARRNSGAILDAAIAALALVGSLAMLSHGGFSSGVLERASGELDWISVLLTVGATAPIVAWRRAPRAVFAATASATVVLAVLGYPIGLPLGPTAALFLLAASRDDEHPWTPNDTGMVVALLLACLGGTALDDRGFPGSELLHTSLAWAGAWFAGDRVRLRREHIADLQERAQRAEREAERERQLAAAEERARIARDLHDSAGNAISVIAVRAGAARLRHRQDPDRSLDTLGTIENLARQTAEEIDRMVGNLRNGGAADGEVEAPHGLASLDTLIAQHAAAGLEVAFDASGVPRALDGAADQAAYRILQEALTNAARYGSGRVRIELAFSDSALEVTVTNPVPARGSPRPGGGHGLVGMRERVTLLGGELDAARPNGAFRVRARIPYGGQRV